MQIDLKNLVLDGARNRYGGSIPLNVYNRINMELSLIIEHDLTDVFMIAYDIARFAKENNILLGPGRGRMAGSMVLYCLGLTGVDPLRHGLSCEMFYGSITRCCQKEIFIDIGEKHADQVKRYLLDKYGRDRTAFIMYIDKNKTLDTVNAVIKAEYLDTYTSKLLNDSIIPVDEPGEIFNWKYSDELLARFKNDKLLRELYDWIDFMGRIKLPGGRLSCSLFLSNSIIDNEATVSVENYRVLDYNNFGKHAGVILYICRLYELDIVSAALELIDTECDIRQSVYSIPLDDSATYDFLSCWEFYSHYHSYAHVFDNIFPYLPLARPRTLEDITALYGLCRPGPIESGILQEYIDRKNNSEKPAKCIHPFVATYLNETYGMLLYVEQIIEISQHLGGFEFLESNLFIKSIQKRKLEIVNEYEKKFIHHASGMISVHEAKMIFEYLIHEGCYSNMKSLVISDSLVLYWLAYLECHYGEKFHGLLREQ